MAELEELSTERGDGSFCCDGHGDLLFCFFFLLF
jgi:hypothetical protein